MFEYKRPSRRVSFEEEIARLTHLKGLIPTDEDLANYGLVAEEIGRIPAGELIKGEELERWRAACNGVLVILRKRDRGNPELPITLNELVNAVQILINDSPEGVIHAVIWSMRSAGLIEFDDFWNARIVEKKKKEKS